MSLGQILSGASNIPIVNSGIMLEDQRRVSNNNVVEIACPARSTTIKAFLAGAIRLSSKATYSGLGDLTSTITGAFGGKVQKFANGVKKIANAAESAITALSGASLKQTWMTKKVWTSTDPITFSLDLSFVAWESALDEVYNPCLYLLSFLYPRVLKALKDDSSTLALFAAPGPTIIGSNSNSTSEPIQLRIGSSIYFDECYISAVDVKLGTTFDKDGYPLSATASITVGVNSLSCVNQNGSFGLNTNEVENDDMASFMEGAMVDIAPEDSTSLDIAGSSVEGL